MNSSLNLALEFFNIQSEPQVIENGKCATKDDTNREADRSIVQMDSDEVVEIHETKTESISSDDETMDKVERVTSSHCGLSAAEIEAEDDSTQPMVFDQNVYRPSLDSCLSDDLSTCSPRPSNLPPNSTPCCSPDFGTEDIKEQPNSEILETRADECVVKIEDVLTKIVQINKDNEMQSASQSENKCFVSQMESQSKDNSQPLKRQCSDNVTGEAAKRQKTIEETQVKGNSFGFDQFLRHFCEQYSTKSFNSF